MSSVKKLENHVLSPSTVFLATKSLLEHVHSQGKVLDDRRVLYKYMNPNLIAVGTEVAPDTKPGISIYLMDAVTGSLCLILLKLVPQKYYNYTNLCPIEESLQAFFLPLSFYSYTAVSRKQSTAVKAGSKINPLTSRIYSSLQPGVSGLRGHSY